MPGNRHGAPRGPRPPQAPAQPENAGDRIGREIQGLHNRLLQQMQAVDRKKATGKSFSDYDKVIGDALSNAENGLMTEYNALRTIVVQGRSPGDIEREINEIADRYRAHAASYERLLKQIDTKIESSFNFAEWRARIGSELGSLQTFVASLKEEKKNGRKTVVQPKDFDAETLKKLSDLEEKIATLQLWSTTIENTPAEDVSTGLGFDIKRRRIETILGEIRLLVRDLEEARLDLDQRRMSPSYELKNDNGVADFKDREDLLELQKPSEPQSLPIGYTPQERDEQFADAQAEEEVVTPGTSLEAYKAAMAMAREFSSQAEGVKDITKKNHLLERAKEYAYRSFLITKQGLKMAEKERNEYILKTVKEQGKRDDSAPELRAIQTSIDEYSKAFYAAAILYKHLKQRVLQESFRAEELKQKVDPTHKTDPDIRAELPTGWEERTGSALARRLIVRRLEQETKLTESAREEYEKTSTDLVPKLLRLKSSAMEKLVGAKNAFYTETTNASGEKIKTLNKKAVALAVGAAACGTTALISGVGVAALTSWATTAGISAGAGLVARTVVKWGGKKAYVGRAEAALTAQKTSNKAEYVSALKHRSPHGYSSGYDASAFERLRAQQATVAAREKTVNRTAWAAGALAAATTGFGVRTGAAAELFAQVNGGGTLMSEARAALVTGPDVAAPVAHTAPAPPDELRQALSRSSVYASPSAPSSLPEVLPTVPDNTTGVVIPNNLQYRVQPGNKLQLVIRDQYLQRPGASLEGIPRARLNTILQNLTDSVQADLSLRNQIGLQARGGFPQHVDRIYPNQVLKIDELLRRFDAAIAAERTIRLPVPPQPPDVAAPAAPAPVPPDELRQALSRSSVYASPSAPASPIPSATVVPSANPDYLFENGNQRAEAISRSINADDLHQGEAMSARERLERAIRPESSEVRPPTGGIPDGAFDGYEPYPVLQTGSGAVPSPQAEDNLANQIAADTARRSEALRRDSEYNTLFDEAMAVSDMNQVPRYIDTVPPPALPVDGEALRYPTSVPGVPQPPEVPGLGNAAAVPAPRAPEFIAPPPPPITASPLQIEGDGVGENLPIYVGAPELRHGLLTEVMYTNYLNEMREQLPDTAAIEAYTERLQNFTKVSEQVLFDLAQENRLDTRPQAGESQEALRQRLFRSLHDLFLTPRNLLISGELQLGSPAFDFAVALRYPASTLAESFETFRQDRLGFDALFSPPQPGIFDSFFNKRSYGVSPLEWFRGSHALVDLQAAANMTPEEFDDLTTNPVVRGFRVNREALELFLETLPKLLELLPPTVPGQEQKLHYDEIIGYLLVHKPGDMSQIINEITATDNYIDN